ncbi:hypothetical protein ACH5RR_029477, partial [Cinchona calisaya]
MSKTSYGGGGGGDGRDMVVVHGERKLKGNREENREVVVLQKVMDQKRISREEKRWERNEKREGELEVVVAAQGDEKRDEEVEEEVEMVMAVQKDGKRSLESLNFAGERRRNPMLGFLRLKSNS